MKTTEKVRPEFHVKPKLSRAVMKQHPAPWRISKVHKDYDLMAVYDANGARVYSNYGHTMDVVAHWVALVNASVKP